MRLSRGFTVLAGVIVAALAAVAMGALTPRPATAGQTNAPPPRLASKIEVQTVIGGLANPWGLQFLPDGRLLVTERPGRLRLITRDGKISPPVEGLPAVDARGQGGLLDVALAPDYAQSGTIYFSYAEPRGGDTNGTSVAKARLVLAGASGRLDGVTVIFRQQPAMASNLHFGSRIVFNGDGTMFITTGERGIVRDQAQNPGVHLGKMIRVKLDGSVPDDNPKLPGWAPEIWSMGHRNSQGAALDPATGQLWTIEHGARGGDELNHPEAGKNYGWPVIAYGVNYNGTGIGMGAVNPRMEQPVYYWDPVIAPGGLAFYSGTRFPGWKGSILAGSMTPGGLVRLTMKDGLVVAEERHLGELHERIRDVQQGPDGLIYVTTDNSSGRILRISPK